ncbi:uncharacterized NTE family protein Mb1092c [Filimonas sp.]|nr:uncharacterized NTE family protein Mb1092c [Filimonas sp.]
MNIEVTYRVNKPFVLSGGGVRGFAHLGVIKALQEKGISPSAISGTSAGAIAGAFIADGFTPDEVKEMFSDKMNLNILTLSTFRLGLISMKKIREFVEKNLRHKTFEELSIPLFVTATDFMNGQQQIFHEGLLMDRIIASCSIPVLFPPIVIDGIPYVDGGISNNLPIEPFADRKEEVVSVYVNPLKPFKTDESVMEVMDRAVHLSFREQVNRSAAGCWLYIEPDNLHPFGLFDIQKLDEIFDSGYQFTKVFLEGRSDVSSE